MNLQFQGWFVSISLRPVLGIRAVNVMAAVWSSCSLLLRPGGGFSICKTVHRIRLRILSLALEKELKVLAMLAAAAAAAKSLQSCPTL